MSRKTFYITTPIYYPSNKLHIGHTYTTVAADALARYHRLRGTDTWFLTGTDEHGQKMERAAREAGKEPIQFIDEIVDWIKELWSTLRISYDDFIRTTEPRHEKRVQEIFQRLYDQGDIYKSVYEGLYCTQCEAFYTESQLKEGGLCPDHDIPLETLKEESYFFRLSKYADRLLKHIEAHPDFIQPPSRRNEVVNFIKEGLQDLSVSRTSFKWGVPVPFDPDHVIYVWIDALANYVTALGWPDGERYQKFWPADVHLIGKDILRFHAIIWPIILMALGEPLPKQVFGHGWVLLESGKMSKARGNVVDPFVLVEKYGVDPVRYFVLREVPFGADGIYSEDALILRTNVDLANDLGNLLSRTTAMINRFTGGVVPARPASAADDTLPRAARESVAAVERHMERLELSLALTAVMKLVGRANKYIEEQAPWELRNKGETERLHQVLYDLAESLRVAAGLLAPFLVETPEKIYGQLGINTDPRSLDWQSLTAWGGLEAGTEIRRGEPIFPRIEAEGEAETEAETAAPDSADLVDIEEFARLDLRVAEVLAAEPVRGADRLLKLRVDVGGEERQVVAGIAQHYEPEALVGRQVVLVANLKPAKIRGIESQGMILAASSPEGLAFVTPEKPIVPGSKVK